MREEVEGIQSAFKFTYWFLKIYIFYMNSNFCDITYNLSTLIKLFYLL